MAFIQAKLLISGCTGEGDQMTYRGAALALTYANSISHQSCRSQSVAGFAR